MKIKRLRGWFAACALVLGTMLLIAAVDASSTIATVTFGILGGASYTVAVDIIVSIERRGDRE